MKSARSRRNLELIRDFVEADTNSLPEKQAIDACARILKSWLRFEHLADSTFVGEFTNGNHETLVQRFWELYVGNRLQNRFKNITSKDHGPDFKVEHKKGTIWVEAVCPTAGTGANKVPGSFVNSDVGVIDFPYQEILKRITGAIDTKIKVFQDTYIPEGIVNPDDYLVIAVNSYLLGPLSQHGISGYPSVLSAVYPIGAGTIEINVASGEYLNRGLTFQPMIFTDNGSPINTDLFSTDNGTVIDAIMTGHIHPYQDPTERKLLAIHNQFAKKGLHSKLPVNKNFWLDRNNTKTLTIKSC